MLLPQQQWANRQYIIHNPPALRELRSPVTTQSACYLKTGKIINLSFDVGLVFFSITGYESYTYICSIHIIPLPPYSVKHAGYGIFYLVRQQLYYNKYAHRPVKVQQALCYCMLHLIPSTKELWRLQHEKQWLVFDLLQFKALRITDWFKYIAI